MKNERKYRTSKEVTSDLLVERLNEKQLAQLLEADGFRDYHSKIIENLQTRDDLGLNSFNVVHSSNDCEIEESDTEYNVRVGGNTDLGRLSQKLPLKKKVCNKHNISSITFINNFGDIYEGSFWEHRELKT